MKNGDTPLLNEPVVASGQDGDDAYRYQEKEVREAIEAAREAERRAKQP